MRNSINKSRTEFQIVLLILAFLSQACSLSVSLDTSPDMNPNELKAVFLGQDGEAYAGKQCSSGTTKDNIHIRLTGLHKDLEPISYIVEEPAQGGVWATPCDPIKNWFLYVEPVKNGKTDLYFKPFRDAPEGTEYVITVTYSDATSQTATVKGTRVKP